YCSPSPSSSPSTTVQAPQSPSAQPSLVPQRRSTRRRYSSTVIVGSTAPSSRSALPSRNRMPSRMASAAAIGRVAIRPYQQRDMVVLVGRGNAEADHHLVEEARRRAGGGVRAEIGAGVKHQLIAPGGQPVALEQRPVAAPIGIGDLARHL